MNRQFLQKVRFVGFVALLLIFQQAVFIPKCSASDLNGESFLYGITLLDREVSGMVTDSSGTPMPGVTVSVKSIKTRGTVTDANGRYILEAPDNAILVFSMIGFESQQVPIAGRDKINIVLRPNVNLLGQTVVTAFGIEKRAEDVVGAVSTIKPEELKVPSSNLTTALAGKLSGVIAFQRSGEPGQDNAQFFIRGVKTFGYKQDPLIMIDNIEASSTDLARLQVDDIASFSILKDATATALYGSRAANGVILIKTKEGREGKAVITLRVENSISLPTEDVKLADPVTYMELANEAVLDRNPLGATLYSKQKIENTRDKLNPYVYPAMDWQRALLKDYSSTRRAHLGVRGGGKVASYYIAGAYDQDFGLLNVDKRNNFNNNINLKTYSLRANVDVRITKTTKIEARISGYFDDYGGPLYGGAEVYNQIIHSSTVLFPAFFPVDNDHQFVKHIMFGNSGKGDGGGYTNPYANLVKGYKEYSRSTMNAQFQITQDLSPITPGLNLVAMINTSRYSYFDMSRSYNPFNYSIGLFDPKSNSYTLDLLNEETGTEYLNYTEGRKDVNSSVYSQVNINYDHKFKEKHAIGALLVGTMRSYLAGNAGDVQSSLPFRNIGLAGKASYSFEERYNFEFNFGYNGSERFYKSNRWGFFPAIGASWIVSKEKFMKPLSHVISSLKLRGTYGIVGNDAIGAPNDRFFYLSQVNMNDGARGYTFGEDWDQSNAGISIGRYSNTAITWEKAYKTNLGLDLTVLENAILNVDVYQEHRTNILMTRASVPNEIGLSAVTRANVGEARSRGVDLSLTYSRFFTQDFWIKERANFTYASNKFLVYEEPKYQEAYRSHVGNPVNQQWGLIAERLFIDEQDVRNSPTQAYGEYGEGDIKYMDVNGDGVVTDKDRVPIGYPNAPEIVYGFGISAGYKGFDISCFFQGLSHESFWIDVDATSPFVNSTQLLQAYADDHWSQSNRNIYALWPKLDPSVNGNNKQTNTWFMRNGSFLRLKQVELGYTLPSRILKKAHMDNLRVYLNGTNLFTFTHFKLWDVEMGGNGLGYPIQRVFNIGVQVSFTSSQ